MLEAVRAAEGRLPDFSELARRAETTSSTLVGWPAPSDSAMAIDDAEYDLATLERLFATPGTGNGAARYLLKVNPHLARALRARYQRWSFSWTPADGLILPSTSAAAIMAKHEFSERIYSSTSLQHYARCPYRFLLQTIHGLSPREIAESIDELDALQRGSLIHDIQFAFFEHMSERNLLPVTPASLSKSMQILDEVIAEIAQRYYDDLAPAIDRVWEDGIASIQADLREWLRRASEDTSGYAPLYFEMSFGLEGRRKGRLADPHSVNDPVHLDCGIQLRGSIDLVENHPTGLLRVTDHKTGKAGISSAMMRACVASCSSASRITLSMNSRIRIRFRPRSCCFLQLMTRPKPIGVKSSRPWENFFWSVIPSRRSIASAAPMLSSMSR